MQSLLLLSESGTCHAARFASRKFQVLTTILPFIVLPSKQDFIFVHKKSLPKLVPKLLKRKQNKSGKRLILQKLSGKR